MNHEQMTPEQRAERGALWRPELDTLSLRVAAHVIDRLSRWAVPLSPAPFVVPSKPEETDLAYTLRDLVAYARTGRAGDWSGPDEARDALLSVSIVYDAPMGEDSAPADWIDASDLEGLRSELAEVCRAAFARVHIAEGRDVPRAWLAALAGVSRNLIDKAVTQEDLELASEPRARASGSGKPARDITAKSARAWLRGRNIEGVR